MNKYQITLPNGITVTRNSKKAFSFAAIAEQPGKGWYVCGFGSNSQGVLGSAAARAARNNRWMVRVVPVKAA
jgi:hypothetical protein